MTMLAGVLAALALAAPPPADYDRLVRTAQSYIDMGRLERALSLAEQATRSAPERPEAWIVWGRGLASAGQLAPAAEKYEKARSLGSRDRQLFVELTSVYDVAKQYDRSIAVYRDWLAREPRDAEMHQELGLTLLLVGRYPDAAASLRTAAGLRPDDLQIAQDLGYALLRAQDLAGASAQLERVVAADPSRVEALRFLAQARAAQGRAREALDFLDRALAREPANAPALRVRARLRALGEDAAGALVDYQALLAQRPDDAPALLGAAGALIALDRPADAAPLVARARTSLGDDPDVQFREAQLAWRRGDRGALATLRRLAGPRPSAVEIWRDLAKGAAKLGDARLAAEAKAHLGE